MQNVPYCLQTRRRRLTIWSSSWGKFIVQSILAFCKTKYCTFARSPRAIHRSLAVRGDWTRLQVRMSSHCVTPAEPPAARA